MKEQLLPELKTYFEEGVRTIQEQKNAGLLSAFPNNNYNKKMLITLKEFKSILLAHNITAVWNTFPKEFLLEIRYSPISMFKRWIFHITNEELLKITEKENAIKKEYFFLFLDGELSLYAVTTNIAHERFLLNLYLSETIRKKTMLFHTYFTQDRKLVIYKDYRKRKLSTIASKKVLIPGKLYPIKASVMKDNESLQLWFIIKQNIQISCSIKLEKTNTKKKTKAVLSNDEVEKAREKVINILKDNDNSIKLVNKFANISLGRVNKVPILINLPRKEADKTVKLTFNLQTDQLEVREVQTKEVKEKPIKVFSLSYYPRSNWLSRA